MKSDSMMCEEGGENQKRGGGQMSSIIITVYECQWTVCAGCCVSDFFRINQLRGGGRGGGL